MRRFDCIIFDFDGTIADTLYHIIAIINENPKRFGIDGIDPTEVPRLRKLSIRYLLREFNISLLRVPSFVLTLQKELGKQISVVKPFDGLVGVLRELKNRGYMLGLISSNSTRNINIFLKAQSCEYFDFVLGTKSLFGKSKKITDMIHKFDLDPARVCYVGDELRDIEAARAAAVCVASVTWGYNDREILERREPDFLLEHPKDLLGLFS